MNENFQNQNFPETRKVASTNFFGTVRKKNIVGVIVIPAALLSPFFQMPKSSEAVKCSRMKFFGSVKQKNFDRKT